MPPFNKKHLKMITGELPSNIRVAGKCPTANKIAVITFATIKNAVGNLSYFFLNNLCKANTISDIRKSLNITSSITAP